MSVSSRLEEERRLDAIIDRQRRSLARPPTFGGLQTVLIHASVLPDVRESQALREGIGYRLRFHDGVDLIETAQVVERFPNVQELDFDERWSGVQAAAELPRLQNLGCDLQADEQLDLRAFPTLRHISVGPSRSRVRFSSKTLEKLKIFGPLRGETDLSMVRELNSLRVLWVIHGHLESLAGIEHLPHLRELNLFRHRNLRTIERVAHCSKIRFLEIERCSNVQDLEVIGSLQRLKSLHLAAMKTIPTLRFLSGCPSLQHVHLERIRVEDRQLDFLRRRNPGIEMSFTQRDMDTTRDY